MICPSCEKLTKERDEARALANKEFVQIQRDLIEGAAHNAAGMKENAELRAEVGRLKKRVDYEDTNNARLVQQLDAEMEVSKGRQVVAYNLEKQLETALLQVRELQEIVGWFALTLKHREDKLGRKWSFGYWEGADPGLALVNGGEEGIENSRFHAALQLQSGEIGRIIHAAAQKPLCVVCKAKPVLYSERCEECYKALVAGAEKRFCACGDRLVDGHCPECDRERSA